MFDNGRLPDALHVTWGFVYIYETNLERQISYIYFPKVACMVISLKVYLQLNITMKLALQKITTTLLIK